MKVLIALLFGTILSTHSFVADQPKAKRKEQHTGNIWIDRFGVRRNPAKEMIGGKPAQFYLDQPMVVKIAKDFYLGRFRTKDDDSTAQLLALVTTKNTTIRPFYRWCLDQTIFIADGALGGVSRAARLQLCICLPQGVLCLHG